jgi:glycosyltransferase involved in cell wall biosynthesis
VRVSEGSTYLASVIVPAHNEEAVLARCLDTLLRGAGPGEIDVLVVANACTDATAEVARTRAVRVIETPIPGKPHALRLGDRDAFAYPRIYLDADVDLTIDSVRALADEVTGPGVLAASPVPEFDLTGVRPVSLRLHKVHDLLMTGRRGLAGAGVYCLNEVGHGRVAPFPDVISDDGFVHRSFRPGERVVAPRARSVVRPAPTFAASVRRRVRVRQGNRELDALGLPLGEGRLGVSSLVSLVRRRQVTLVDAGLYLVFVGVDRALVEWRRLRRTEPSWGTDVTSRQAAGGVDPRL